MTFIRLGLATTTALGLSMAMAHAGSNNNAYLDQDGATNSGSVTQSAGNNNDAGSIGQKIKQAGVMNELTIIQSGDNNDIGLGSNADDAAPGLLQDTTGTPASARNKITIKQLSDGNAVGSVVQRAGDANNPGNYLNVRQDGTGGNTIGSVYQNRINQATNSASITQNGTNNTLDRVSQHSNWTGSWQPNRIQASMWGQNNGGDDFRAGGAAAASGAVSSNLIQGNGGAGTFGNTINIAVGGTSNEFGVSQYGRRNSAENLTITGSNNELGIAQTGTDNTVYLGTVAGSDNHLGIRQFGAVNEASLTVTGDQNGGFNDFGANVAGTLASGLGMTAGLINQVGYQNDATLSVSGTGNIFATLQDSPTVNATIGNTIVGNQDNSLSGGVGNQVAVAQVGDNNNANFNQVGSGNIAAISQ